MNQNMTSLEKQAALFNYNIAVLFNNFTNIVADATVNKLAKQYQLPPVSNENNMYDSNSMVPCILDNLNGENQFKLLDMSKLRSTFVRPATFDPNKSNNL